MGYEHHGSHWRPRRAARYEAGAPVAPRDDAMQARTLCTWAATSRSMSTMRRWRMQRACSWASSRSPLQSHWCRAARHCRARATRARIACCHCHSARHADKDGISSACESSVDTAAVTAGHTHRQHVPSAALALVAAVHWSTTARNASASRHCSASSIASFRSNVRV